jgi:hypothetical protein
MATLVKIVSAPIILGVNTNQKAIDSCIFGGAISPYSPAA